MKSYAVIGLGRFGTRLAIMLSSLGNEVLAIDMDKAVVDDIADHVTRAVAADARDKDVLKGLGVPECDVAVVAMGGDLASSVLITMNLKTLGCKEVIAKAYDETHREILEKLGADSVIIPEQMVADKLAHTLNSSNVLEYIELSPDYGIVEYKTPAPWVGKTVRELNIRAKHQVNLIAAKAGEKITVSPTADYRPEADDTLVMLGEYKALDRIKRIK